MAASFDLLQIGKLVGSWLLDDGGILMSAISGTFGVFADQEKGRKWTVLALVGVLGGMIWALASANYGDREREAKLNTTINKVENFIDTNGQKDVQQVTVNVQAEIDAFARKNGILPAKVQEATVSDLQAWQKAATLSGEATQRLSPSRRAALTVWVFPHAQGQVDFATVRSRLEQLAANVPLHPPVLPTGLTNSVWYSGGAQLEEAKAAALIATSAGLQIMQICPAEKVVNVPNLLQIGGSGKAKGHPVLDAQAIQALTTPVCAP